MKDAASFPPLPKGRQGEPACLAATESECLDEFTFSDAFGTTAQSGKIRRYQPRDRQTIRRICCDTGFLGNPIDTIYHDRALFADLFTEAYLLYEPNWAFVVETEGRVVGYLLGSLNRKFDRLLMQVGFRVVLRMLFRLGTGQYARHPRSRQFVRWLLICGLKERPKRPSHSAHLHLDLEKAFRGRGIGLRLWLIYEQRLKAAGIKGCYGEFFSHPKRRPERIYTRYGFKVFDRKRTSLFEPNWPGPMEVVCVYKQI